MVARGLIIRVTDVRNGTVQDTGTSNSSNQVVASAIRVHTQALS